MKSVRLTENRQPKIVDVEKPVILKPTDVLVRMAYASICSYDMMVLAGQFGKNPEGHIGHEGSGIVAEVGAGISAEILKVGDHVTIEVYEKCRQCEACRSGKPEYCLTPGGRDDLMSEYVVKDLQQVFKLPSSVSLKAGCLIEPLIMGMYAINKARLETGKSLIILGGGAMGLIMLKLAVLFPLSKTVVVDPHPEKREMAIRFGATLAIDPYDRNLISFITEITNGHGFDAVIEASGNRKSAKISQHMVARGGSVVYFGLYGDDFVLEINPIHLYWSDATISAVCVPSNYFPNAINIAPRINLEEVITGLYPFSKAAEGFAAKATGIHAKVMLEF